VQHALPMVVVDGIEVRIAYLSDVIRSKEAAGRRRIFLLRGDTKSGELPPVSPRGPEWMGGGTNRTCHGTFV
jgi:hypothetical protein